MQLRARSASLPVHWFRRCCRACGGRFPIAESMTRQPATPSPPPDHAPVHVLPFGGVGPACSPDNRIADQLQTMDLALRLEVHPYRILTDQPTASIGREWFKLARLAC